MAINITARVLDYSTYGAKKVFVYGDSFSDETSTSVASLQPNWVAKARNMLRGCEIINRASAGASIASARSSNPDMPLSKQIGNQILNEERTDADLIILYGGLNDYRLRRELGKYNLATPQLDFCGALYRIAQKFHEIGPNAKVVVITPPKTSNPRPDWESGKSYKVYDVVKKRTAMWPDEASTPADQLPERYYVCVKDHTSSGANMPPNSEYWEWIDFQLRPTLVYRAALATWAASNGYTLIDGYSFPLFVPGNDHYGYVQADGVHYTPAYSQEMADYIMEKIAAGGDTALANDSIRIDLSDWMKLNLESYYTEHASDPTNPTDPSKVPDIWNAYADFNSNGQVELWANGSYPGTEGVAAPIVILPEHLIPKLSGSHLLRVQSGTLPDEGVQFLTRYCDLSNLTGVGTAQRAPATETQYFSLFARYMTRFDGYNPNQV